VKAWTIGEPGAPEFSDDFEVLRKAVLQVTDIKTNRNKYYAIELHKGKSGKADAWRVFTHYGRTDDLEVDPDAGQKESRYFDNPHEAEGCYQTIYREKTSPRKGYKELSLASSKIGSQKARGSSVGEVDSKTLEKLARQKAAESGAPPPPPSKVPAAVQSLVRYIYDEATSALTSTVSAKITANGIETPLGILTIGQIEKGEKILTELYDLFQKKNAKGRDAEMERLSGEFYTEIPHRIGRTRSAVADAVIKTMEAFQQKQETLQLMKDMLKVNGEAGSVLFDAKVDAEYDALKCDIAPVEPGSGEYKEIEQHVVKSQIKTKDIRVHGVYKLRRGVEWDGFAREVGNDRLLMHGSRIQNWVGILSRGILLPKIVVSMGVNRTDAGWLGNGIYFGDAACTSYFYTTPGRRKTRLMALARVALGKMKDYTKITYGLAGPPYGHHSCHGVRNKPGAPSEFADDEYVVFRTNQQRLEYLIEMS
jgi:poly [ADP-ribose] polymerase